MKNEGWISLHRKIQDNWIFKKNRVKSEFEAWIIMLLEVNHAEEKVLIKNEIIICGRGESIKSLETWAGMFKWTKSKVFRFFKLLESDSMIVLKSTHKSTHLTICNYENYQNSRNDNETKMKHRRNTDETQMKLNNNDNNDNKDNKEEEGFADLIPMFLNTEEFLAIWKDWIKYRKEKRKPITASTAKLQIKFLEIQENPIECIQQSIRNGWMGIFELKSNNKEEGISIDKVG